MFIALSVMFIAPQIAVSQPVAVPSGGTAEMFDWFIEEQSDGQRWARLRFVSSAVQQGADYFAVEGDFLYLCDQFALPALHDAGEAADKIVLTLAAEQTEYGVLNPEIQQFFEAFRVENASCILEEF